jgi:outer membrane protein assembly factor BamB
MYLLKFLGILLIASLVTACGHSEKRMRELAGERIDAISTQASITKMEPALFSMPLPTQNASWPAEQNTCNLEFSNASFSSIATASIDLLQNIKYTDPQFSIYNEALFLMHSDGAIESLDKSLNSLWQTEAGAYEGDIFETPKFIGRFYVTEDSVFATYGTSVIKAFSTKTGKLKWNSKIVSIARSSPQVYQDIVIVQTVDNKIAALSAIDGKVLWLHYGTPSESNILHSITPAIHNGILYVNYSSKEIFALNIKTGAEIWSSRIQSDEFSRRSQIDWTNIAPQIFVDASTQRVIATSSIGEIAFFDLKHGDQLINTQLNIGNAVSDCGSYIYYKTADQRIGALSKKTGIPVWDTKLLSASEAKRIYWSQPVITNSNILIVNSVGEAFFYDTQTGALLDQFSVSENVTAHPVIANKQLYLMTNDGDINIYGTEKTE